MGQATFDRQFAGEACELVVRIFWCWTKKSGAFPEEDGLCRARARFDQAIDPRTDELVGEGLFNWLEWLTPKRHLGHPYGYAFREGHCYRLLVRAAHENGSMGDTYRYQVVQLLESDVDEPRLDPYRQFCAGYRDEEVERTLLVEGGPLGWLNGFGYRRANVRYIALAQGASDAPRPCVGHLRWMERADGLARKTNFDDLKVYRVRVREGKDDPRDLLLVSVVRKLRDARFEPLREAYLRPVELQHPLGTLVLDRRYCWYEGSIDYLGEPCNVLLNVEEGSTDAAVGLARLEQLAADLASVDRRVRSFAASSMLENACDWCDEELTCEDFMGRMSSPSMSVDVDGSVEFLFDDGGMFAGHVIVVDMDADDTLSRADIAG